MSETLEELNELLDDLVTEGNNRRADYDDFGKYPSMDKANELKDKVLSLWSKREPPQWATDLATVVRIHEDHLYCRSHVEFDEKDHVIANGCGVCWRCQIMAVLNAVPAEKGD